MLKINTLIKHNAKFTTATVGCFLRFPLTKHNFAYASLLAQMQMDASLYFPTIRIQQNKLASLYDLDFEVVPQLFGKEIVLSYVFNFVEPLELLDPDYTYRNIVEKMALIIQHPSYDSELINLAKRQLISDYQELMQVPSNVALDHFFKLWYQKEPNYKDNFIGSITEIEKATPDELKLFGNSLCDVPSTIIGWGKDEQQLNRLLRQEFKFPGLMREFMNDNLIIPATKNELDQVDEHHNLQAQIMMGYGMKKKINYCQQIAGMVLMQYLTGDSSSRLFNKVREKLGAAYAIEASSFASNSLFLISTGIDSAKITQVQTIIKTEIEAVQMGKIDPILLKKAKKVLINLQKSKSDQETWQLAQMLRNQLFKGYADLDNQTEVKKVTATKLSSFAQNLFLNESYVLK